ncbi:MULTISPECIES: hypothetical protein [Limosilactobacillus]|jgi:hypothetical protein|uniref:hypothetical protein n=1 Tax=Limosilactobacillus TaxID=2742598 RepID=UPI00070E108A|nr:MULTISPECIES: hypothetical protein [Limosilactobacillus]MCI2031145.1 hypothetical protein [Limosilactobacillus sp.]MCZ2465273.1 hypothetical protein [Limosilactobacillus vaginalis]QFG72265.1 hypothetical protein LF145_02365 [Limosilactobacillus frumenti]
MIDRSLYKKLILNDIQEKLDYLKEHIDDDLKGRELTKFEKRTSKMFNDIHELNSVLYWEALDRNNQTDTREL